MFGLIQVSHIVAVCSNVVGGTREGHQEKAGHGALKPERRVQCESHSGPMRCAASANSWA